MATISTLKVGGLTHPSRNSDVKMPYLVEFELDFAAALTAKGSALAASDVINCLVMPAGTVVLGGGTQIKTAANSTTTTVNFGVGGGSDFTSGLDAKSAAGTYGTDVGAVWKTAGASANTLDITLATLTGTLSTGKLRVWALLLDVSDANNQAGIALVGS